MMHHRRYCRSPSRPRQLRCRYDQCFLRYCLHLSPMPNPTSSRHCCWTRKTAMVPLVPPVCSMLNAIHLWTMYSRSHASPSLHELICMGVCRRRHMWIKKHRREVNITQSMLCTPGSPALACNHYETGVSVHGPSSHATNRNHRLATTLHVQGRIAKVQRRLWY